MTEPPGVMSVVLALTFFFVIQCKLQSVEGSITWVGCERSAVCSIWPI